MGMSPARRFPRAFVRAPAEEEVVFAVMVAGVVLLIRVVRKRSERIGRRVRRCGRALSVLSLPRNPARLPWRDTQSHIDSYYRGRAKPAR